MGASEFMVAASGKTAKEAFARAVGAAQWESGHGGYTGTIAEKGTFTLIPLPAGKTAREYADELLEAGDERIDSKWGPAGCIDMGDGKFLFFGWASS